MELKRINDKRQVALVSLQTEDNTELVGQGQPPDAGPIIRTATVYGDRNPFPIISNPGPFIVDVTDTEKQITIKKIQHAQNLALYAKYADTEAAVCILLRKIFLATLFSDLNSSTDPILNKVSANQMLAHLEKKNTTKFSQNTSKRSLLSSQLIPILPDLWKHTLNAS